MVMVLSDTPVGNAVTLLAILFEMAKATPASSLLLYHSRRKYSLPLEVALVLAV